MIIRKHLLPRRLIDWLCFLLIAIFMPINFMFEMMIVLPAFHEPGGFWHTFTFALALFLILQIEGNFVACLIVDTSVDFKQLKPPLEDKAKLESLGWRECEKCQKLAPPRSWHCTVCQTCILKRDHHCIFMGCCVGHKNHRYFIVFVLYSFIGLTYALIYNSLYFWLVKAHIFCNWLTILKMTMPLLMLVSGSKWHNILLIFYILNILTVFYTLFLILFHGFNLIKGSVSYNSGNNYHYNMGSWKQNFLIVFGKRMHLVWLSPLLKSDLPHDGILWYVTTKERTDKNK